MHYIDGIFHIRRRAPTDLPPAPPPLIPPPLSLLGIICHSPPIIFRSFSPSFLFLFALYSLFYKAPHSSLVSFAFPPPIIFLLSPSHYLLVCFLLQLSSYLVLLTSYSHKCKVSIICFSLPIPFSPSISFIPLRYPLVSPLPVSPVSSPHVFLSAFFFELSLFFMILLFLHGLHCWSLK